MRSKHMLISVGLGLSMALTVLGLLSGQGTQADAAAGNTTRYVASGGSDIGNACTSYGAPCETIQHAVDQAQAGDEVYVATGVYTGVQARSGVTQVVYISKTVTVRGGYGADFEAWDPVIHRTVLDAQDLGRVLFISGSITPALEGLWITGGNGTGLRGASLVNIDAAGGLHVTTAAVTISGCVISQNCASTTDWGHGGGLYLDQSAATLVDNVIVSNTASTGGDGDGGGLYLHRSPAALTGNAILSNTGSTVKVGLGGGVALWDSAAKLTQNRVSGNRASSGAGGDGGGIWTYTSTAVIEDNVIQKNAASAVDRGNGGGLCLTHSPAIVKGNVLQGNHAGTGSWGNGGGLSLSYSPATVLDNRIVSNTATLSPTAGGRGGGVWVYRSSPFTLTNNWVVDNQANTDGAGMWLVGSPDYPTRGRLLHTTIADNHGCGQGVYMREYTTLAFANTIIAGHAFAGVRGTSGSTVTLDYTLWHDNGTRISGGSVVTNTHDVTGDPVFFPGVWDYHLGPGSAAIDAGKDVGVVTDIDGDTRPSGAKPDLGADEAWRHVWLPLVLRRR